MKIDISGIDKTVLLMFLFNSTKPKDLSMMQYKPTPMTYDNAESIIATHGLNYDCLQGRCLKINLEDDYFESSLYDRDNGPNSALNCIIKAFHSTAQKFHAHNKLSQASKCHYKAIELSKELDQLQIAGGDDIDYSQNDFY